jgi:hypothetical protein
VIRVLGVEKKLNHSVVDAISGITYPPVRENPKIQAVVQVVEDTVSPVAPFVAETEVTVPDPPPPEIPSVEVAVHRIKG